MPSRKITINTNPVANGYTGRDEKIIEFSSPGGGGLISFRLNDKNELDVSVYRTDDTVTVALAKDVRTPEPR